MNEVRVAQLGTVAVDERDEALTIDAAHLDLQLLSVSRPADLQLDHLPFDDMPLCGHKAPATA
jgi:hypothetical protein